MAALSRVPCPHCGVLNLAQDAVCLGCGCRFSQPARPPAAAAPRAHIQFAPDESCPRCYSVLLPAAQFDTSNTLGGIDIGSSALSGSRHGREIAGVVGLFDLLSEMLIGGIRAKHFEKRLKQILLEAPHSLCCPSCHTIVRR